jgi:hypothetical protein
MQFSMVYQLELASKCSATIWTSKWIDGTVEARMHVQMFLLSERLAALFANERTLASMEFTVGH